jgi:CubicO group peptidase (beta-lactamase class C family)
MRIKLAQLRDLGQHSQGPVVSRLGDGRVMRSFAQFIAVCCLLATAPAFASDKVAPPPATIDQLDTQLAAIFEHGHIPGASVALIEDGRVAFVKGYGFADTAQNIPVTPDTVFRAGSISKSLTSIAIMTVVEQGKLSLDSKLADLAPEVKFYNPWEATDPVRLVHLLEHTTGWPDIYPHAYAMDGKGWSVLRGVQYVSPQFVSRWKPGYFFAYNNAGPPVAAVALEKATGQEFAAYMRDRVLRPMGMSTADFDLPPELAARVSKSYEPDGSETPYQFIILPPAGSLAATPRELAQLVRFYLGRGTIDGKQILSPESVARIERSESTLAGRNGSVDGYGLGNAPFPGKGVTTFRGHNGSIDSFSSVYGYSLRNGSGYVLMANGGEGVNFDSPVSHLVEDFLTRNIKPVFPPTAELDDKQLQSHAGVYRTIAPINKLYRPFFELTFSEVSAEHGQLRISDNTYIPTSENMFRRSDRDESNFAFVDDDGATYKISPFGVQEKTAYTIWLLWTVRAVEAVLAIGTIVGLILLLIWIIARLRGRTHGGFMLRLWPLASMAAMIGTFALPLMSIMSSGMKGVHLLSDVGPYSISITVFSVLFPIFAALGLLSSIRTSGARALVRINTALTSVALLVVASYAFSIGWIGICTWAL